MNKKCPTLKRSYSFEKWSDFDEMFGEDPHGLQVSSAHIFKSIGLILKKLRAKMCFFTFSKMVKNTPMTRKIHLPKHWHYEFFSIFGFGFKHSIAFLIHFEKIIFHRPVPPRRIWFFDSVCKMKSRRARVCDELFLSSETKYEIHGGITELVNSERCFLWNPRRGRGAWVGRKSETFSHFEKRHCRFLHVLKTFSLNESDQRRIFPLLCPSVY